MDAPVCRVLFSGQLVIDQRWGFRLCDPFWRLYFNRDAGATVSAGGRTVRLAPHQAVLVPAWSDAHGVCTNPVRHFYVHFETPGLPDAWIRTHCPFPIDLPEDGVLRAMLDDLAQAERGHAGWHLRVQAATAWALARGLAQIDPQAVAELASPVEDAVVAKATELLSRRLAAAPSVAALAKASGLSKDHFAKRFLKATGRTVLRWLHERRVTAAADRLIHSDDDIDAIALAVGYANRYHFTRMFTRLVGTPPATYRRQHQGRTDAPPRWAQETQADAGSSRSE
jgi:AraC-like DNA-binding protein